MGAADERAEQDQSTEPSEKLTHGFPTFPRSAKPHGSADWMDRNLSRRVEVVWPIENPELKQRLIREVLGTLMADNVKARELLPDGSYRRIPIEANQPRVRSQERFLEIASQNASRRLIETPPPPPYMEERPTARRRPRKRQVG